MKFAFLIMSSHEIDSREERAAICDGEFSIISVNDIKLPQITPMLASGLNAGIISFSYSKAI